MLNININGNCFVCMLTDSALSQSASLRKHGGGGRVARLTHTVLDLASRIQWKERVHEWRCYLFGYQDPRLGS